MGRHLLRVLTWKALLYLVVAVVLAGVTRDLTLTGLLTIGFAAGDSGVAALLRAPIGDTAQKKAKTAQKAEDPQDPACPRQVPRADHSSAP